MINLDFIAVDGGVDIRGGRLSHDGNELLDEKNGAEKLDLLNQIYPIGSLFICKTGTGSPASKYGGDWTCVAQDIVMPLGSTAPVNVGSDNWLAWSAEKIPLETSSNLSLYNNGAVISSISNNTNAVPVNLKADLAGASNSISGVDVWLRIEKI